MPALWRIWMNSLLRWVKRKIGVDVYRWDETIPWAWRPSFKPYLCWRSDGLAWPWEWKWEYNPGKNVMCKVRK